MAAAEIRSSSDQKKLIIAIGLGVVALVAVWWAFVGFGSSKPQPRSNGVVSPSPSPAQTRNKQPKQDASLADLAKATPIDYRISLPLVPEPRRNIFAFYEPPPPPTPIPSTPTPTPTPPWLLASISPSNVY